nr:hypothetical protein [Haliangium ochraceum]
MQQFVMGVFEGSMHSKRVESLSNAVVGVTQASALSVQAIGHGLAVALDKNSKHAIKQVDRLLSNARLDPWQVFGVWVPYVLSGRTEAIIALDWTEFAKDGQSTCAAHLVTTHGRSTALAWKTVEKSQLRGQQTAVEDEVIDHLHRIIPPDVEVTLLAESMRLLRRWSSSTLVGSPSRRPFVTRKICALAWVCRRRISVIVDGVTDCCCCPQSPMPCSRCSGPLRNPSASTA